VLREKGLVIIKGRLSYSSPHDDYGFEWFAPLCPYSVRPLILQERCKLVEGRDPLIEGPERWNRLYSSHGVIALQDFTKDYVLTI